MTKPALIIGGKGVTLALKGLAAYNTIELARMLITGEFDWKNPYHLMMLLGALSRGRKPKTGRNKKSLCDTSRGEPVDAVTGEVFVDQQDLLICQYK